MRVYHCKKFCVGYMGGADTMQDVENFVNKVNKEASVDAKVTWLNGDGYTIAIVEWAVGFSEEWEDV